MILLNNIIYISNDAIRIEIQSVTTYFNIIIIEASWVFYENFSFLPNGS